MKNNIIVWGALLALLSCTGCRSNKAVEITLPGPDAEFPGGQEIAFSAKINDFEGSRITALWNFGDGTTAQGLAALHSFDRTGAYEVTLTVTNEFKSTASDNRSIEITSSRFVKLESGGIELDDSAASWLMVSDRRTGLIWEMKTNRDFTPDYGNPHDGDNTYTWYDDNPLTNGGDSGTPGNGTDTADFIDRLNAEAFGGFIDWRMPGYDELASIQDTARFHPAINPDYFPGTASWYYWTATTYPQFPGSAYHLDFMGSKPAGSARPVISILNHYGYKWIDYHARAVRSAP